MVYMYQQWSFRMKDAGLKDGISPPNDDLDVADGTAQIILIDSHCKSPGPMPCPVWLINQDMASTNYTMLTTDRTVAASLVRQGMIPNAPYNPSYAVSIRLLELYRNLRCRCPRLSIQPFVKGLIDTHGVRNIYNLFKCGTDSPKITFKQNYAVVFSTCYDVYLEILEKNRGAVMKVLHRDDTSWRLKNTCPACSYKLQGEKKLVFEMLITMDGNNSLKRLRRDLTVQQATSGDATQPTPGTSGDSTRERPDPRSMPGNYYLTRDEVDKWAKSIIEEDLIGTTPVC
jgi:hypothetical protein